MITDELYINNIRVDLDASTDFAFSFSINDVKEPEKRSRSVSKTINIPGTQNNLNIFFSAYSLPQYFDELDPVGFDFDPRQTYEAKYYVNNQLRFNGFAQIIKTKILNEVVNFEIVLFSNVVNFINQFGDIKIAELGWDEYGHKLTHDNISKSWNESVRVNGVLTSNFSGGLPQGFGYYYGLVDYGFGGEPDEYADNRIFPMLYQREILIKAFALLGYTITGGFIKSAFFKKMLLAIGGGEPPMLDSTELNNRLVDLTITKNINRVYTPTSTTAELGNRFLINQADFFSFGATVVQDIKGQYNLGTIQIANDGNYRVILNGNLDYNLTIGGTSSASFSKVSFHFIINKNGGVNSVVDAEIINTLTMTPVVSGSTLIQKVLDLPLAGGDVISISLAWSYDAFQFFDTGGTQGNLTVDLDTTLFDFELQATDSELINQDDVNLAVFAPDMKVSDFITSVIKQHNLQVDEPNDAREIKINFLELYYGSTSDAEDWTYKQDLTKEIEIEPIAVTQPKRYVYEYADDNDFYHALYKSKHETGYGNFTFENPTLFTKGDSAIKLPYTITPLVDIDGTDLKIPRIIKVENSIVNPYKGKPRIYFVNPMQTGSWTLLTTSGAEPNTVYATYPLAHHLDNITTPTIDLCFGTPIEVFYTATAYTTNNLFQFLFRRFINEFTSIDGRLLTSYFKLDEGDFIDDFFSVLKKIRGVVYRLNKINDTVLNSGNTSQVELVKVLESTSPRTFNIVIPKLPEDKLIKSLSFEDEETGEEKTLTITDGKVNIK